MSATILVVDDDPDIQEMLQLVIRDAGYDVVAAWNGQEALALMAQRPTVSLVLLDLMMPIMNGLQFLAELAKDPERASIPIVAVTGAGSSLLESLPPSVPILRKPFAVGELMVVIERLRKQDRP
jgi:CheY-like chemotaxis protein